MGGVFLYTNQGGCLEEWSLSPKLQANGAKKDFAAQINRQDVGLLITDNHTFERSLIC